MNYLEILDKINLQNEIKEIILSGDRVRAGKTVSPEGLYLNKVNY